jgi:hypothetical protein
MLDAIDVTSQSSGRSSKVLLVLLRTKNLTELAKYKLITDLR